MPSGPGHGPLLHRYDDAADEGNGCPKTSAAQDVDGGSPRRGLVMRQLALAADDGGFSASYAGFLTVLAVVSILDL